MRKTAAPLLIDGRELPVRFRVNARARRLILRLDEREDGAVVTLPPGVSEREGRRFAEERADWLRRRLERRAPRVAFADGAAIPFLGEPHTIAHVAGRRAPVRAEHGVIAVSGQPAHLERRVYDWLKVAARREIEPRALDMAGRVGRRCRRVTIRDTRSRWGSCSTDGALSFSWRLVLAPAWVLEYVVAHEVAHLVEHNHGPGFWRLVARLNGDAKRARAWLAAHGPALHRYG